MVLNAGASSPSLKNSEHRRTVLEPKLVSAFGVTTSALPNNLRSLLCRKQRKRNNKERQPREKVW